MSSSGKKSTVGSGLAVYGRFRSTLGLFFAGFFFIILLASGIYVIVKDPIFMNKEDQPLPRSWDPWIGAGLIVFAILSLVISIVLYKVAHSSRSGAQVVGVYDAVSDISQTL